MPEAVRAGEALPVYDMACPFCGRARELEGGHRVPSDTCCYPRMLVQLGWMVPYLKKPDVDAQERSQLRQAAASIRRLLAQASTSEIDQSLRMIAEVSGARSIVYRQAYDVSRLLRREAPPSRGGE